MLKLYKHQKIALTYMRLNNSFYLAMEQGTGKTIPTLKRIQELFDSGLINSCLVIAPKSALGAWERDIELFTPEEQEQLKRITLINYDKVWRGSTYDKTWDCIVIDEAHMIKTRTSARAKFILKLSVRAKYRYALSGTMIGNGQLENVWSQYCFLDPYLERGKVSSKIFGSYSDFTMKYCIIGKFYRPIKYIHVDELQNIINNHCYRVKKSECLDLPEKLPDEIRDVELLEKAYYKKLAKKSAIVELEVIAENPLARMTKLRQLTSGYIVTDNGIIETKCEKIKVLEELLEGYENKIVIFAEFKYSIKKISELLDSMKLKHVVLDGEQKDKTIWRKFQTDEAIKAIVVQYQSGCAGIDLFAADTIVYYEPTLRSTTLEQSRDRIHRTGQVSKCSYIHLITKGTIEENIYKALANYSDFSEKMFLETIETYQRSYTG